MAEVAFGGFFFFSSRRRHTRLTCDWSSDVCSSDLGELQGEVRGHRVLAHPPAHAIGAEVSPTHPAPLQPSQKPRSRPLAATRLALPIEPPRPPSEPRPSPPRHGRERCGPLRAPRSPRGPRCHTGAPRRYDP